MSGAILIFTHTPSWCAQELFFISAVVMFDIFIFIGLQILDVMTYRGYAVGNYFSDGTVLFIARLDAFPDCKTRLLKVECGD